ncbi:MULTISPECIES: hypothetical protein [Pseudomonas syringae group]|uniref:hypothetical protein n=1 Tax=Pseudomonas syringae group TaxID=136849 RepID=UPI001F41E247|nr:MULTISPECIES: hypothetical protein [Pseudomonas syringae group]
MRKFQGLQKIKIVSTHYERAFELSEQLLDCFQGRDVEMVVHFVEQQQLRLFGAACQPGERCAQALATTEPTEWRSHLPSVEPGVGEDLAKAALLDSA